ncbi:TPA: hypothetical protein ACXYK5_002717 [Legionella pneumophila]
MNKTTRFGSKRTFFLMILFSLYYLFIALILSVEFSVIPKEQVLLLWQKQWPQYLFGFGFVIGLFLTLYSCAPLSAMMDFYWNNKSYQNAVFMGLEILIQWVWLLLPIELINHGQTLGMLNSSVVIGGVVFAVSFTTFRCLRIKTIKDTMQLVAFKG